jgi:hypothetical protein
MGYLFRLKAPTIWALWGVLTCRPCPKDTVPVIFTGALALTSFALTRPVSVTWNVIGNYSFTHKSAFGAAMLGLRGSLSKFAPPEAYFYMICFSADRRLHIGTQGSGQPEFQDFIKKVQISCDKRVSDGKYSPNLDSLACGFCTKALAFHSELNLISPPSCGLEIGRQTAGK